MKRRIPTCNACKRIQQEIQDLMTAVERLGTMVQTQSRAQVVASIAAPLKHADHAKNTARDLPPNDELHLVVIGGQRVSKQQLMDLQRDAARYRWLRDKADGMACNAAPMVASLDATGRMIDLIDGEDLDAAVDIVMALPSAQREPKTKRAANAQ